MGDDVLENDDGVGWVCGLSQKQARFLVRTTGIMYQGLGLEVRWEGYI